MLTRSHQKVFRKLFCLTIRTSILLLIMDFSYNNDLSFRKLISYLISICIVQKRENVNVDTFIYVVGSFKKQQDLKFC
jgi:hypothetical protein